MFMLDEPLVRFIIDDIAMKYSAAAVLRLVLFETVNSSPLACTRVEDTDLSQMILRAAEERVTALECYLMSRDTYLLSIQKSSCSLIVGLLGSNNRYCVGTMKTQNSENVR